MKEESEQGRHQKARIYMGKLTELLCAERLEKQGYRIINLAALGDSVDIRAISPENVECSIEVKYIGEEDRKFFARMKETGGTFDPYNDSDYCLYIAYTGAKQLVNCDRKRIVIIIVSNLTWPFFEIPLRNGFIF